ncbi:RMD1 family protein [[Muricauda] lutisoli]|uniref:RMD1 family protein n=1 Tax=[Muricauda] lutisoli TaxID=2816035 RepID=A0ABS3EUJ9_9FLAO|nr:RMD1 family protein [[Muricauda] lutisoli]MBO0329427.1 RMD1 family protein [[Muricauda] lutisoli]
MESKAMALHLAKSINIPACRRALNMELIYGDRDELFYSDASRYLYIFRYGVVSFFGYSEAEISQLLMEIKPFCEEWRQSDITETMEMELVSDHEKSVIDQDKVILSKSNVEGIRLALLHLSQSVALDHFAGLSEQAMKETRRHTTYLELNGRLDIGGKKLKKHIAKVLNINNQISENLYIFDSHEVVWEDLELDRLDKGLKQIFDLKERYRNIKEQGIVIKENLSLFMNIMDHRESSRLEWIIIILILVEVVDLFIMRLIS